MVNTQASFKQVSIQDGDTPLLFEIEKFKAMQFVKFTMKLARLVCDTRGVSSSTIVTFILNKMLLNNETLNEDQRKLMQETATVDFIGFLVDIIKGMLLNSDKQEEEIIEELLNSVMIHATGYENKLLPLSLTGGEKVINNVVVKTYSIDNFVTHGTTIYKLLYEVLSFIYGGEVKKMFGKEGENPK
ncbi:MAG: hypothetical protein [Caudoviricetes sp.]|nr:MAG: hypothetical protein [Caudoviricetes sp.]